MFFICNNSLLFDPEAHVISLVGQPESVLTLSAPAVRLLQEFIKHRGRDLSREELIARVWEEFGFTPSGNNLNKAVSELRKSFQFLGEGHEFIVTVPRYGFRFDADVIFQPGENIQAADPQPPFGQQAVLPWRMFLKRWLIIAALIVAALGASIYFSRPLEITVPAKLKPVEEKIARCSIWIINDHGRPLVLSKLAERLEANNVACEREEYDIYYFSARFSLAAADEVFIGACPVSETSLCKTIRYKNGAEE
ncbi:winged helix-turn-helix domain-containing protein [Citrobacter europaeus]|uniref:winged helix-turn-helix domain-containing protein n=1 Tax=Citrobacter europaeus TaxID=1914243 RepID=UPI0009B7D0FD|nr:winged helix-turn-helix domain-containing protein [Citrobacter europaeus]ARC40639.1 transcriptional regulator [Citrobacter braakii]MBJ8821964.1 winged helix-turn-helix domain-containing protein [Citrobacter freundii]MBJ8869736.1 winged helix-turn-helix domain-containing protein [Citrobacter braakii]MBJ8900996.1 winged helix-turn-helix domain-containing protein [Citrobacter braakii]MBJ8905651.1 winged helix-turn-helix domain-containing protein [Citrobacter braakii]